MTIISEKITAKVLNNLNQVITYLIKSVGIGKVLKKRYTLIWSNINGVSFTMCSVV